MTTIADQQVHAEEACIPLPGGIPPPGKDNSSAKVRAREIFDIHSHAGPCMTLFRFKNPSTERVNQPKASLGHFSLTTPK